MMTSSAQGYENDLKTKSSSYLLYLQTSVSGAVLHRRESVSQLSDFVLTDHPLTDNTHTFYLRTMRKTNMTFRMKKQTPHFPSGPWRSCLSSFCGLEGDTVGFSCFYLLPTFSQHVLKEGVQLRSFNVAFIWKHVKMSRQTSWTQQIPSLHWTHVTNIVWIHNQPSVWLDYCLTVFMWSQWSTRFLHLASTWC